MSIKLGNTGFNFGNLSNLSKSISIVTIVLLPKLQMEEGTVGMNNGFQCVAGSIFTPVVKGRPPALWTSSRDASL